MPQLLPSTMKFIVFIPFLSGLFCAGLAVAVLFRDRRTLVHQAFVAGMFAFAFESVFTGLSLQSGFSDEILRWQRFRAMAAAFLPGCWLLFALTFGRANAEDLVRKYRFVLLAIFVIPLVLATVFPDGLLGEAVMADSPAWTVNLRGGGSFLYVCFLVGAVLILMSLVDTLRASIGRMRWQIKFMILGIGAVFAFRLYSGSQTLLFSAVNSNLELANSVTMMVGGSLAWVALSRLSGLRIDIYLSRSFLHSSLTVSVAGTYLIAVGILAKVIGFLEAGESFYLDAFLVFLAFLGLFILLLSDRFRRKVRRFVSFHFKRPQFDYRKEWTEFIQVAASLTDIKDFCAAIARKVSKTFDALSVSIWLLDEAGQDLEIGGSTVLSETQAKRALAGWKNRKGLIMGMRDHPQPVDFDRSRRGWAADFARENAEDLKRAKIRVCVPMRAGGDFQGLLTMNDRVGGTSLLQEELELAETIADQTAGVLLNLRLFERLRKVKETETIQCMSAFMVHDLKNLASMLSLAIENLPVHYDNPDFRKDVLTLFRQSLRKIEDLWGRLVLMGQKIELKRRPVDLNRLVADTVAGLNGGQSPSILQDLHPLPRVFIDPEQIQKVVTNLIFNAKEALGEKGEIRIATRRDNGWVVLLISDNGCGMTGEFMEKSLFRPFKTTKKTGMGIGLYHSKMIVEAHQAGIDVESEPGQGSTFRVRLPITAGS
jgi:putative PEP-CTERM system histidine kinase